MENAKKPIHRYKKLVEDFVSMTMAYWKYSDYSDEFIEQWRPAFARLEKNGLLDEYLQSVKNLNREFHKKVRLMDELTEPEAVKLVEAVMCYGVCFLLLLEEEVVEEYRE